MRDLIIRILFTESFTPMRELFALQMIGDTLKIGSWILAYLMLGRALVKLFIISEILFAVGFVSLTYLFTEHFGLHGAVLAHAVNYFFYWIVMSVSMIYILNNQLKTYRAK